MFNVLLLLFIFILYRKKSRATLFLVVATVVIVACTVQGGTVLYDHFLFVRDILYIQIILY